MPKNVFLLYIDSRIVFCSSNLKASYKCLISNLPQFDREDFISYSQIARRIKKKEYYILTTQFIGTFKIVKLNVYNTFNLSHYSKFSK